MDRNKYHFGEYPRLPRAELAALVELRDSLSFEGWSTKAATGWVTIEDDPLACEGIDLKSDKVLHVSHITKIVLPRGNLKGTVPESIGELTHLEILHLYDNELEGPIPESISNLVRLREILAHNNHFTSIPTDLGRLEKLRHLRLEYNNIRTPIPPSIGRCHKLETLLLSSNKIPGAIPDMSKCHHLTLIAMNDNMLTGPIPIHFASSDHSCKMLNLEGNEFELGPGGAAAAQKLLKQLLPGAFVGV